LIFISSHMLTNSFVVKDIYVWISIIIDERTFKSGDVMEWCLLLMSHGKCTQKMKKILVRKRKQKIPFHILYIITTKGEFYFHCKDWNTFFM
jgi:hypothetical protein